MLNFYCCFLPGIAHVLRPLTDACSQALPFCSTSTMQASFQHAKSLLSSAVHLQHPVPSAVISLATDASDSHVGAVLQQRSRGSWRPLTFFSHKPSLLSPAIPSLTGNCWLLTWPCARSVFSSRDANSCFSRTTNP
jgi:hypothetical protein